MFFGAKLKAMPPKLVSGDGQHVAIRPMAYVAERDLTHWVGRDPRISHHSLHLVWQPGKPATQADRQYAERAEKPVSRPAGEHVFLAEKRGAWAPDGPQPAPVSDPTRHRCGRCERRQSTRRRAPARGARPSNPTPSRTAIQRCPPGTKRRAVRSYQLQCPERCQRPP